MKTPTNWYCETWNMRKTTKAIYNIYTKYNIISEIWNIKI